MIRDHVAGTEALLAAGGFTIVTAEDPLPNDPAALPLFPGGARDGVTQERYAVLWTDSGTRTREKLPPVSGTVTMLVTVTSVGSTEDQVGWVAEKAFAALLDQVPVIAGRSCSPISHEVSDPLRRDDDVVQPGGAVLYQQVDVFRLVTWPS